MSTVSDFRAELSRFDASEIFFDSMATEMFSMFSCWERRLYICSVYNEEGVSFRDHVYEVWYVSQLY